MIGSTSRHESARVVSELHPTRGTALNTPATQSRPRFEFADEQIGDDAGRGNYFTFCPAAGASLANQSAQASASVSPFIHPAQWQPGKKF
jgi:hypothetical protein